jgi:hypothetical protein
MDYECERGAKRNFEPWREAKLAEETEEERLDRLEKEEAERDSMKELETKVHDAKTEMAIADALDEIRSRNARIEKADRDGVETTIEPDPAEDRRKRQEEEDAEAARQAFANRSMPDLGEEVIEEDMMNDLIEELITTAFTKKPKEKKDFSAALGLKKKATSAPTPVVKAPPPASKLSTMLVAGYDSDDD